MQDLTRMRRLSRVQERGLERRLFCGLLRAQERVPLRWLLR
jgi:hypothetical protein